MSSFSFQQVTYYADFGHQKLEKTTINEQDAAGCDKNQNANIRVNLLVPSVPPTDYTSSNIIKVVYVLHVSRSILLITISDQNICSVKMLYTTGEGNTWTFAQQSCT